MFDSASSAIFATTTAIFACPATIFATTSTVIRQAGTGSTEFKAMIGSSSGLLSAAVLVQGLVTLAITENGGESYKSGYGGE